MINKIHLFYYENLKKILLFICNEKDNVFIFFIKNKIYPDGQCKCVSKNLNIIYKNKRLILGRIY